MISDRSKSIIKDVLLGFLSFLIAFGSKGLILNNLGNYDLVGPDPYLYYGYMVNLYTKGYIPNFDPNRYFPIGTFIDNKDLVAYLGFFSLLILKFLPNLSFLNIFGIYPLATKLTWLAADFTIPLFFGLSSFVFFLLAKELLKDRKLALISAIIYSITPLIATRVIAFDTELGAILFIVLSLYLYVLGIKSNREKSRLKKYILLGILIAGIAVMYYFVKFVPNSDNLQTFFLLGTLGALMALYPVFKPSREYFFTLLVFSTILARKGWGGWIIIPIIIGITEVLRFVLKRDNYEIAYYAFFIPYFSLLEYGSITIGSFFEIHNIIILSVCLLYALDYLFSKYKIYDKIYKLKPKQIDKATFGRLSLVILLIIVAIPYLLSYINTIISPYSNRMITSVAEFQKFSGREYLRSYSIIGSIFSALAISYLLWDKKQKWKLLYTFSFSILLLLSLFLLDDILSLRGATAFAWGLTFLVIFPWIVFFNKDISEEELFILVTSIIMLIVGKYIYRLAFFAGFSLSFLFPIAVNWLNTINEDKKNRKRAIEILTHLIFISTSITAVTLVIYILKAAKIFLFLLLLPIFSYIYFIIAYYFLNKNVNLLSYLKFSLLFLAIYGFYTNFGYIANYLFPLYVRGTSDNIIYSMLWLRYNTENDSIVHFWWDYGYYVRFLGNRTVWLSGDNLYPYWNHLMGRYGLAGDNFNQSLELFYVHSVYNYHTFKILELFNKNYIFYHYLYKKLNFTKEDLKIIESLKRRLGSKWITLLFKFNGSKASIKDFNLNNEEYNVLEKLYKMNYVKPSYLYLDPTDIGKSYQFTRLGSNDVYDKHSWISTFVSVLPESYNINIGVRVKVNGKYYYVLANNDTLYYIGNFPLDQDLYINGEKIPRCIPDLGVTDCGRIIRVNVEFSKPIVKIVKLREVINESLISPWLVRNITAILYYNGKYYNITLGCLYLKGARLDFPHPQYRACLYVTPSLINHNNILDIGRAYFISQKSMNYTWVKLYFFSDGYPYFGLVFYVYPMIPPTYRVPLEIYQEVQPSEIWRIHYPENFTVPEYKYCLYLATNLKEINECSKLYHLGKTFHTIWEV